METTERTISFVDTRWNLARILVAALVLLAFISLVASFPQGLMLPASLASGLGMLLGGWSILKTSQTLARCALIVEALIMSLSLLVQLAFGSVLQALPSLLLTYVMILFSAEALDLIWKHSSAHSRRMYALQASYTITATQKSLEHIFGKLRRLPLLFGAGFILALVAATLGNYFASISSVLSDISVYIVAVSISLALLLVLRED